MDIVVAIGIVITVMTGIPVILQLRRHPKGMHILFFTEMWERFSYYGMRTILLAYMTQHFLFEDTVGQGQYGAYTSLVYLLPLIGGMLADRYLGTKKAIAFGALLLVAGHLAMAIEQAPARNVITFDGRDFAVEAQGRQDQRRTWIVVDGERYTYGPAEGGGIAINDLPAGASLPGVLPKDDPATSASEGYTMRVEGRQPLFMNIFFGALALIIMGVGFLKANISTIVGQLYQREDPRRDAGFTLYYYGINLGAFWAQVLCAGIGATYGWGWGFGLAGIGMLFGWLVFVRKRLLFFVPGPAQLPEEIGNPPEPEKLAKPLLGPLNREWLIYISALLGIVGVYFLVQREPVVNITLSIASGLILIYFVVYMIRNCTWIESQRMILALILIAASVVFFTLFELAGSALNQFAERSTQLPSNGFFTVTSGQTQSFNGAFILLFAPLFATMWTWLEKNRKDPGDAAKFALGLIQVGAGFLVLVWGAAYADESAKVPLIFLVLLFLLHTTGELFLSPVGLSAMTKLAPVRVASTMMATWFLASSVAQALQAQIAKLTAQETIGGQVLDPQKALDTYVTVFTQIGWVAIGIGVALGAASPFLNKLAHSKQDADIAADKAALDAGRAPS
ncbi:MAG: oligopeptide:H+ symporter [Alphaproteobacteria bacterium]|nr:oligopeptide:H+ symporter [Alphaproteobacteria bacterium]